MTQAPACDKMYVKCMGDLLKWVMRFTPLGMIFNNGKWLSNKLFKTEFENTYDDLASLPAFDIKNILSSAMGMYVATNRTGRQIAEDEYTAMREDSRFQRNVADMEAAGLNPALMYGSSASSPSVNSAAAGNSGSISDLLQLAMLPLEMKAKEAEINRTKADTQNIIQRTRTEEQETRAREIAVQFMPSMSQAKIDEMYADIDLAYSSISLNESREVLINNQSDAQEVINEYLPAKLQAEIGNIHANTEKASEDAKLSAMRNSFERIQRDFARENHFLMSSSDSLQVAVYLGSLLGLTTSQVTEATKQSMQKVKDMLENNPHYFD